MSDPAAQIGSPAWAAGFGRVWEGGAIGTGLRIAIVAARWNDFIGQRLVEGARETLIRHGVAPGNIDLAIVPGSFELGPPLARLAASGRYDALIAVGIVIRGATAHFEHVAGEATAAVARVMAQSGVPVAFGVLTVETIEQAIERAGTKAGNKGAEAATVAIEMANLMRALPAPARTPSPHPAGPHPAGPHPAGPHSAAPQPDTARQPDTAGATP